jgi:electron transport complex protein RnfG
MWQAIWRVGAVLALFAVVGAELVTLSYQATRERIQANERAAMLGNLNALIPRELYDNDLLSDRLEISHKDLLGTPRPVTFYRARLAGQPQAIVFMPVAPDGYGGPIRLLVGIRHDGVLLGVRVLSHQETPGLGDKIELKYSDWILGFSGRSLDNPQSNGWRVQRDGGLFDQFTGATITPRAVVKAVHKSLQFYRANRAALFAEAAETEVIADE